MRLSLARRPGGLYHLGPGPRPGSRAQTRRQLEDKKLSQSLKSILMEISLSTLSNDKFIQRQINNSNPPPSRQFYPSLVRIFIFSRPEAPRKPGVRSRYAAESGPGPGHRVRCREPGPARALKSPTAGSDSDQLSLSSRCFPEQLLLLLPLPQGAGRASLSPIINTTFSITPRVMAVTIVTQNIYPSMVPLRISTKEEWKMKMSR